VTCAGGLFSYPGKLSMTDHTDQPDPTADESSIEDELVEVESDDEGVRHVKYLIRRNLPNRRLDKYLSGRLGKDVSRNALQDYIRDGTVTVNGKTVKPSYKIVVGDDIDLMLPVVKPMEVPPEDIPLDVIYEDDDLIAINKQADLIVHPARGNWTGTLVNGLANYFKGGWRDIKELPSTGEIFRPGIVHRLDRDTTGIMLVAKSELALTGLGHQFEYRHIEKTYSAILHGLVKLDEDVIDAAIGKHPKFREKYAVHRDTGRPFPPTTKSAITRYKVLRRLARVGQSGMSFTLVEFYPKTGRTHQLRVHASWMGHPIVGDKAYGGGPLYQSQLEGRGDVAEGPLIVRQALHAHTIAFWHPRTKKRVELEAPWPDDFVATLASIDRYASGDEG
jgi:23S rRNA pseudouridine1911/1915/1917 synthase